MPFLESLVVQIVGGAASGLSISGVVGLFAIRGRVATHDGAIADLNEDARLWISDRDRARLQELSVKMGQIRQAGAAEGGAPLRADAALAGIALHEYRDEIQRKRRRYRDIVWSEGKAHGRVRRRDGHTLVPFVLDDESREILSHWRSAATTLAENDPTVGVADLGRFERSGDSPTTLT